METRYFYTVTKWIMGQNWRVHRRVMQVDTRNIIYVEFLPKQKTKQHLTWLWTWGNNQVSPEWWAFNKTTGWPELFKTQLPWNATEGEWNILESWWTEIRETKQSKIMHEMYLCPGFTNNNQRKNFKSYFGGQLGVLNMGCLLNNGLIESALNSLNDFFKEIHV